MTKPQGDNEIKSLKLSTWILTNQARALIKLLFYFKSFSFSLKSFLLALNLCHKNEVDDGIECKYQRR